MKIGDKVRVNANYPGSTLIRSGMVGIIVNIRDEFNSTYPIDARFSINRAEKATEFFSTVELDLLEGE